jgi:hypothetical protein
MRIDGGTWIASLAPLSLGLGAWPALCVLAAIGVAAIATNRLLHDDEKQTLRAALRHSFEMLLAIERGISGRAT